MTDEHESETGYSSRIRDALTLNNVVLVLFGVAVGAAVVYGLVCR